MSEEYIVLGRISGLYGVKGWVKVFSHTEPRENIVNYPVWYLKDGAGWKAQKLESGKAHGKGVVARLAGCDDRDVAAALVGRDIAIPSDQLPKSGPDEYYWSELIGLKVLTENGNVLGQITGLMETGANDVLVVKGEQECLIPYVPEQVVLDIDLEQGEMRVDWDPEY